MPAHHPRRGGGNISASKFGKSSNMKVNATGTYFLNTYIMKGKFNHGRINLKIY